MPSRPDRAWPGRWAAALAGLGGWRRRLAAALLGALAAAALPPVHALPVLLVAFPGLVWLLDATRGAARPRLAAFAIGWWFGFGHFTAGLYWIAHALLTDPARFGWMIPFAVFGLAAGMALFIGLAALLARLIGGAGAARVLALAAAWTAIEWLRSWVLTGFPWNLLGTAWVPVEAMLQVTALTGVYGLSFLTVLVAAMPAVLADDAPAARRGAALAGAALLLAATWAAGAWRLAGAETAMVPDVRLRIVQANIAQTHKWREDLRESHLLDHVELSRGPGFAEVTHVVWPETAAPFFLDIDARRRQWTAAAAPPGGLVLTGAPRATPPGSEPFQVWNSLLAVDARARIVAAYDKVHLVPFGEYVPLRGLLPIAKITQGGQDFSAGPGRVTLDVAGLPPVSPLICYEAIFPASVTGSQRRPDWLLNVTNDGWFGLSAGPYQHLASARLRAVEEGLPLVRAANTGISAVIDPYGRTVARLGLGQRGVLDSQLPRPLAALTPYARYGDALPISLVICAVVMALALRRTSAANPGYSRSGM